MKWAVFYCFGIYIYFPFWFEKYSLHSLLRLYIYIIIIIIIIIISHSITIQMNIIISLSMAFQMNEWQSEWSECQFCCFGIYCIFHFDLKSIHFIHFFIYIFLLLLLLLLLLILLFECFCLICFSCDVASLLLRLPPCCAIPPCSHCVGVLFSTWWNCQIILFNKFNFVFPLFVLETQTQDAAVLYLPQVSEANR